MTFQKLFEKCHAKLLPFNTNRKYIAWSLKIILKLKLNNDIWKGFNTFSDSSSDLFAWNMLLICVGYQGPSRLFAWFQQMVLILWLKSTNTLKKINIFIIHFLAVFVYWRLVLKSVQLVNDGELCSSVGWTYNRIE